jgi:transmembrane 9 superfamily protein 2/4
MSPRSTRSRWAALCLLLSASPALVSAFYLPGMAPKSYAEGEEVELHVNHLRPSRLDDGDAIRSVYSYDYYSPEFHFCQPDGEPRAVSESLGSIVFGDRIFTSPFRLHMRRDEECLAVCSDNSPFSSVDARTVNDRIRMVYMHDWFADGLPAGSKPFDEANRELGFVIPGFPLGVVDPATQDPYINNHFELQLKYHRYVENEYRVVGFTVNATSRADSRVEKDYAHCGSTASPLHLSEQAPTAVTWTYSVRWEESDVPFATRWDKYLQAVDPRIHWFFLVFSAVFVCLLVAMVSTVLVKTLRRDIARYNRLDEIALEDLGTNGIADDGVQEDSGWKLVHGDVFRQPVYPLPLSVFVGNGAQLFVMAGCTIGAFPRFATTPH